MEENNNNKNNSKINRRDFFKLAGAGTFASIAHPFPLLRQEQPFGQRIGRFG